MMRRLRTNERGAIAAQAAAMVPLLTVVVVVVLFTGRVVEANNSVQAAAHEAARAATLTGNETDAADAAQTTAAANLNAGGLACRTLNVVPDLSRFHAGGSVTVTVTCTADFSDMDTPRGARLEDVHRQRHRSGRRLPGRMTMQRMRRGEDGAVALYAAIMMLALLATIGLVLVGGQKVAALREATNVADNAARAGAQHVDLDSIRSGGALELDAGEATAAVADYLSLVGHTGTPVVSGDTITVTVTISFDPVILPMGTQTVTATESASARAVEG